MSTAVQTATIHLFFRRSETNLDKFNFTIEIGFPGIKTGNRLYFQQESANHLSWVSKSEYF